MAQLLCRSPVPSTMYYQSRQAYYARDLIVCCRMIIPSHNLQLSCQPRLVRTHMVSMSFVCCINASLSYHIFHTPPGNFHTQSNPTSTVLVPKQQLSPNSPSSHSGCFTFTLRVERQAPSVVDAFLPSLTPSDPDSEFKLASKTLYIHAGTYNIR